jgi:hypothetical protein
MIGKALRSPVAAIALALSVGLACAVLGLASWQAATAGAAETSLAIDADPTGNTAESVDAVDNCVEVSQGDTFSVDFVINDAANLLGWETYLAYDKSVLSVADRDVQMFLTGGPEREVFDASERTPDNDGLYRLTAVDIASPPYSHTGSGVLARVTFQATGEGVAFVSAVPVDRNDDGKPDIGPVFKDTDNHLIGDSNGDSFFDGPTTDARVAVGTPCSGSGGALSDVLGGGGSALTIVIGLAMAVTAVGLTAGFTLWARRTRAGAAGRG